MTSRLQAFATRNRKQDADQVATAEAARLSRKDIRLHRQRARAEPTLLDTDVESIGESTTLDGYGVEPNEDIRPHFFEDASRERDVSDLKLKQPFLGQYWTKDDKSTIHYPKYVRPTVQQDQLRRDRGIVQVYPDQEWPIEDAEVLDHGLLDKASSLSDSPNEIEDARDQPSLSQVSAEEETPKRKIKPIAEREAYSRSPLSGRSPSMQKMERSPSPTSYDHHKVSPLENQEMNPTADIGARTSATFNHLKDPSHLDYPADVIEGMSYEQLEQESFDYVPSGAAETRADLVVDDILQQLQEIASSDASDEVKHRQRMELFSELPIEKHEQVGDKILEHFASVFKRFQNIRQRKRQAAQEFENRVASRAAEVRNRQEALAESTKWLKKQGEDVIRGSSAGA